MAKNRKDEIMTPQFTAPAYVRVEDAEKLISVCNTLRKIGYTLGQHNTDSLDDFIITYPQISSTYCTGSHGYYDDLDKKGAIDCKTDINLFLELAQMRSDTDKGQWFKCISKHITPRMNLYRIGDMIKCESEKARISKVKPSWKRATPQEVYEHLAKK